MTTFVASVPRNAWQSAVSSLRPPRHRPTAPSPSQTSTRGTAPNFSTSRHHPANKSSAQRFGISTAESHREYPHAMVSTGRRAGLRACPNPTGSVIGGNHRSHWAISPAAYVVREAGSGGRYTGRNSATRSDSTRIDRFQPIRSAITVAGIVGYARNNSRIRGSTASTIEPFNGRTYFGGASEASAARTVFLETPKTRAITLIGKRSDLRKRRISAQSSTDNTLRPPRLDYEPESPDRGSKFGCHAGVSFHPPSTCHMAPPR
ncbi:1-deoxy-D-xylulose 5-phosphate synthase [Alloactinosynnema sp. L-07]|nr:1-deoxy-D-xylulose 5-phosphate synthase [Alloactinosynnema sp. L-07]